MAIQKLNMEELDDGIKTLETWEEAFELALEQIEVVKELIEDQEGDSVEQVIELIEEFEENVEEQAQEISEKLEDITTYRDNLEDQDVTPINRGVDFYIEDMDEFKIKLKNLIGDVQNEQHLHVDKANKSAVATFLEKEEKEELKDYIDLRNQELEKTKEYTETKFKEMEKELEEALELVEKLEAFEEEDHDFSSIKYKVVRKMV